MLAHMPPSGVAVRSRALPADLTRRGSLSIQGSTVLGPEEARRVHSQEVLQSGQGEAHAAGRGALIAFHASDRRADSPLPYTQAFFPKSSKQLRKSRLGDVDYYESSEDEGPGFKVRRVSSVSSRLGADHLSNSSSRLAKWRFNPASRSLSKSVSPSHVSSMLATCPSSSSFKL